MHVCLSAHLVCQTRCLAVSIQTGQGTRAKAVQLTNEYNCWLACTCHSKQSTNQLLSFSNLGGRGRGGVHAVSTDKLDSVLVECHTVGRSTQWEGLHRGWGYTVGGTHSGRGYTVGGATQGVGLHRGWGYTVGGAHSGRGYTGGGATQGVGLHGAFMSLY